MSADAEHRREIAERRQRYRGERKVPYKPRPKGRTVGQKATRYQGEVSVSLGRKNKRAAKAAARRAGLSLSAWIRELVEDSLRVAARETDAA